MLSGSRFCGMAMTLHQALLKTVSLGWTYRMPSPTPTLPLRNQTTLVHQIALFSLLHPSSALTLGLTCQTRSNSGLQTPQLANWWRLGSAPTRNAKTTVAQS